MTSQSPPARQGADPASRLNALERALVLIRWLGIGLGVWQIFAFSPPSAPRTPGYVAPAAGAALALLASGNIALAAWLRRPRSAAALHTLGYLAFAVDIAFLHGLAWLYSFDEFAPTWVILYILSIEGALRYQLRGAVFAFLATVPLELLRDLYRREAFGFPWHLDATTFRLGIMALIAAGAGVMASGFRRQREEAERRAVLLEQLAARESAARRELTAFHGVLLAGVSRTGMADALSSMLERTAADLGYESLTVLLLDDHGGLRPVAARGLPEEAMSRTVALGEGIAGSVAARGVAEIVPDVAADPRYLQVDARTRSQADVPIMVGDRAIGVLNVESTRADAFGAEDLTRLETLAAQMALIIENARYLARERQTVERMRELDQMKSDFVAITSHELRTPLTAMRGFIKTMQRPDFELSARDLREFLSILDRQSDKLARLVEELLVMSRLDAGALQLLMAPCDVGETLREMLHDLEAGSSRVQLAVQDGLPRMITDGQRLQQIARNLVENALKFSPADEPVRITAVYERGDLVLEVTDRGEGIPPAERDHVFEMFFQVGGPMRRRAEGFGLGLHIAKRLVEALGGRIELESEGGRGSTFRVRIPFAGVEDGAETETA